MSSIKLKIKQLFQQKSQRRPTPKASELPAQQQKLQQEQQQEKQQQSPRYQPQRPRPNQETSQQFQTKNLANVNQENEKPLRYNSSTSTSSLPPPPYNEPYYSDEQRHQFQDFHVNLPVPPNVLPMTIFEITEQRRMQRTNQHPEFC